MIYVITEDGYSISKNGNKVPGFGLRFWLEISDVLNKLNGVTLNIVTSQGNSNFIRVFTEYYNPYDTFILSFDRDISNIYIREIVDDLDELICGKHNIVVLKYVCFEHILLTFKLLLQWVGVNKTERFEALINALNGSIVNSEKNDAIVNYCMTLGIQTYSHERMIKAIVADICKGINYFNIGKGADSIGKCWFCDCCIHSGLVYKHSKCGLKENRLTKIGKIIEIIKNTDIEKYLNQAGVEIMPLESEIEAYIMRSLLEENNEVL